jgi:hypothetical protein
MIDGRNPIVLSRPEASGRSRASRAPGGWSRSGAESDERRKRKITLTLDGSR